MTAYREKVVTDEAVIANALLTFENTVKVLPFEDQRELLQLLVKGIRVDRLDPKKDKIPGTPGTWNTQIRTQWYAVNLELYATDLVSGTYEKCTLSSHSKQTGGPGVCGLRTSFGIRLTFGVPLPQYNLAPFLASPFSFTLKLARASGMGEQSGKTPQMNQKHPICKALEWQKQLDENRILTKVEIAEREGISKSRITQMFQLLNLPTEAKRYLSELTAPLLLKAFSVRQLMGIAKMPPAMMVEAFERLKLTCEEAHKVGSAEFVSTDG